MSEQYRSRQDRNKKQTPVHKKRNPTNLFKRVLFIIIAVGLLGMVAGGVTVFSYIAAAPKLDLTKLQDPLSSKVYDMNQNLIADLGVEKRTKVTIDEIPEVVKNAFISVEDVRFKQHIGVDFRRIVGAAMANVTNGFGAEGGSTITQQVVKNSFLSPEKSLKRKVQEAWLAIKLEQQLSKNQILEIYLNKIYFSKSAYGVAKAAETYFGKDLKDITLAEAALLAGMPQSPNNYNPIKHPDAAEKRRNTVLSLMEKNGFITKAEADEAKSTSVTASIVKEKKQSPYDAFIDRVLEEVSTLGNIDIGSAGLKIYTTLDPNMQTYVEKVLDSNDYINFPNDNFQAGIVLLDTKSGEIRAIGGGRNRVARGLNYATDINPQPGSTIKPILDYGPAIEHLKWSTYHQIVDEQYSYSDGTPIREWDSKYWGSISLRRSLEWSRNIPALKTLQEVGLDQARTFGNKLGLGLPDPIYESYSIGGFNGVSPLQLAGAYSAFGNEGIYTKPHTVTKVVFPDERTVQLNPEPVVAMSDYTAFMITDMLRSVVKTGTGRGANIPGLDLAGKTGTTNFSEETIKKFNIRQGGVPDIWFAGYTPEFTMSVWTGYEKTTAENYIYGKQQNIAKDLFKLIMQEAYKNATATRFKQPNSVVKVGVEEGSSPAKLASEFTPKDKIVYEYFVKGTEPTEVSKQFAQIAQPDSVMSEYDEKLDRILIRWNYPDDPNKQNISFLVTQAIDGEKATEIASTKELFVTIDQPKKGAVYTFELTAISDHNKQNKSEPVQIKIETPKDQGLLDPLVPDGGNPNTSQPDQQPTDPNASPSPNPKPSPDQPKDTPPPTGSQDPVGGILNGPESKPKDPQPEQTPAPASQ